MTEPTQEETQTASEVRPKPPLSTVAIAGAMVCLGVAMMTRGGAYIKSYIMNEARWMGVK